MCKLLANFLQQRAINHADKRRRGVVKRKWDSSGQREQEPKLNGDHHSEAALTAGFVGAAHPRCLGARRRPPDPGRGVSPPTGGGGAVAVSDDPAAGRRGRRGGRQKRRGPAEVPRRRGAGGGCGHGWFGELGLGGESWRRMW
jgi:hypothetical protein